MLSLASTTRRDSGQTGGKGTIRLEIARRGASLYNVTTTKEIHGFSWTVWTRKTMDGDDEYLSLGIRNNKSDESNCWFAETTMMMHVQNNKDFTKDVFQNGRKRFDQTRDTVYSENLVLVDQFLDDSGYFDAVSDVMIITIAFDVNSLHGSKFLKKLIIDWSDEVAGSDVCLVVGGRKFYLAKHMLVRHTRHFESMFFGSWKESSMDTIALHDLDASNFELFLNFIHGASGASMNRFTVLGLLELAHRFGADAVLTEAEAFLWNTGDFALNEILVLTDRFMLPALKDHLLTNMNSVQELSGALNHYDDYTPDTNRILNEKLTRKMEEQERELEILRRQAAALAPPPSQQYNNHPFHSQYLNGPNNFPQNNQYLPPGPPPGLGYQQPGPSGLNNQGLGGNWNPPPVWNPPNQNLNFPPMPPIPAPAPRAARRAPAKRPRKAANAANLNAVIAAVAAGAAPAAAIGNRP